MPSGLFWMPSPGVIETADPLAHRALAQERREPHLYSHQAFSFAENTGL